MRQSIFLLAILIFLCIVIIVLSQTRILLWLRGEGETIVLPAQIFFYSLFNNHSGNTDNPLQKLQEENRGLLEKSRYTNRLERDINALRDQFQTASPQSTSLLPAHIIGSSNFIPGISTPEDLIIDKGKEHGIKTGQIVIYKNNLVGRIKKTSPYRSQVILISSQEMSFTAITSQTSALGVLKGKGLGEMLLENVVLSDDLKMSDLVLTKGDMGLQELGVPPDLIIGKIISLDKKQSSLFQSAKVKSLLDFSRLSTVFIFTKYQ